MSSEVRGTIYGINGPIVYLKDAIGFQMAEMVYVGTEKLVGEVISLQGDITSVQVYEETSGMKPGEPVVGTGAAMSVTLGPGILNNIYDGIERPLEKIAENSGKFITRGVTAAALDEDKKWDVTMCVKEGDTIHGGQIIATCPETPSIIHKSMMTPTIESAVVVSVNPNGTYTVNDPLMTIETPDGNRRELTLAQKWPIRVPRPTLSRLPASELLVTGQRVLDTIFPITRGGTAAIPGGFGTGKTMTQHSVAKFSNANVIIYIGCGERGNEMTEVLEDFSKLEDPQTGNKLMARTALIANTSNMPVAAREASVYTAMTIGEYYRAMGLKVLLLADSTSRWAQALREMSNRMEELPGADAFPVDLPAIISNFYSRAGIVKLNNGSTGSVTFIGTVSPAGGNLKEPVTESTKKAARCFYALNQSRADRKRYPAVDPIDSYSKYLDYPEIAEYLNKTVDPNWVANVNKAKNLILRGKEAYEQINILGDDGVPMEYHNRYWKSELIDFIILQQDAFDSIDCSTPMDRQEFMLKKVLEICDDAVEFETFEECGAYYKNIINVMRQMNYSEYKSADFNKYLEQLNKILSHDN